MSSQAQSVDITIVILTYNGEKYIDQILRMIYKQKIEKTYEVLIVDSGSKDETLEIISKYPEVRLKEIPNSEFGHGKTRNLAARIAKGEIIVYLTHDAIPADPYWLYEMTKPFEIGKDIVAVMGKQVPRANCFPLLKYEIQHVFNSFGPDFGTTIFYKDKFIDKKPVYDAVRFYSDVNSATRKDFLLNTIAYQDVEYAEDQLFGEDVIEAGYKKAYAPRAAVEHSNDLTIKEYRYRMFDETLALRKMGMLKRPAATKSFAKATIKGILGDTIRIIRDRSYGIAKKIKWIFLNPFYHIQKWRGVRQACKREITDQNISDMSLEKKRRSLL